MKVLVFGASGLLGRALVDEWSPDEAIPATSKDADIRDASQVRSLVSRFRPGWVILAAGYADVDGCEEKPTLAQEVNCGGAENVARAAREFGSRMMFISSDYVFDGAKSEPYEVDDPVRPLGRYGRSKAAAEATVREILLDGCIVRTSWLFGAPGKCFPNTILELAAERRKLAVVSDQRGSPTFNRDLARAIVRLVQAGAKGMIASQVWGTGCFAGLGAAWSPLATCTFSPQRPSGPVLRKSDISSRHCARRHAQRGRYGTRLV